MQMEGTTDIVRERFGVMEGEGEQRPNVVTPDYAAFAGVHAVSIETEDVTESETQGDAEDEQGAQLRREELITAMRERFLDARSEEHTSELQSLMRISYAVFYMKKKMKTEQHETSD